MDLDLPDEVYGFGSWLLWVLATRATSVVDAVFAAGPARPSRHYGIVDGHPVPTPSLVAWLLAAAEFEVPLGRLAQRDPRLDERQKVLRTIVSRAIGGEPRLFKDGWLRQLADVCGLGDVELELLSRSRGEEGFGVDPAALRAAIARTLRARPADTESVAGSGGMAAPRSLPRDISGFTGRESELDVLMDIVHGAPERGVVVICTVGGMAGVGKTAFAVHAAHKLAPRFPDGQVFLPLHGHTPGRHPVDPADALASLLSTAGVAARQIPPGAEARSALWRDHLATRRLLIVLDDAVGHDQVQPLLPGTGGSLVLVTSRRHLTALDDARSISLDTLPPDQAAVLLVRLAARPGLDLRDTAVAEIARLCGYLPLALGMLARQLHHHPSWTPADLAADLAGARVRLELMHSENLSVAAAFDLSYQDLDDGQRRLFRCLGLHPGTDVDAFAAAALDGSDLAVARRGLDGLYDQYLLTEPSRGRYRLHDLIREHARALAAADRPGDQDAAVDRLLDYYLHAAAVCETVLARQTRAGPDPAAAGSSRYAIPDLADHTQVLTWARAEQANLLACLDHATSTGRHARVVALTAAIDAVLRRDGRWADDITRHLTAVQAARHIGDRAGEAGALHNLGAVRRLTGDYPGAAGALEAALIICRDLGDRLGEANALNHLGLVTRQTGDHSGAARAHQAALGIYRDLGAKPGQASALSYLGVARWLLGDHPGAAQALEEALVIYRHLGDRLGEANALNPLGAVRRLTGDYPAAIRAHQAALGIFGDLGDRLGQANALNYLGAVHRLTGDLPAAIGVHQAALGIFRGLGHRLGQANALSSLGGILRDSGDFPGAAGALEEALTMFRALGARGGTTTTLNEAGTLYRMVGDLDMAVQRHQQALDVAREIDSEWDEAHALAGLGRCALAAGQISDAMASLGQAHEIFQRIGAAEATPVAAELDALATPQPVIRGP